MRLDGEKKLLSASDLGKLYGLTGEEMNRALVKLGFIKGTPGDYDATDKGLPYIVTKAFHRGPGGYSQYNRDWITRSYDESIIDVMDVSDELIAAVKKEVADARAKRYADLVAARAKADAEFLINETRKKALKLEEEREAEAAVTRMANLKKVGKVTLVIVVSAGIVYGVYKATPYVKEWWNNRREKSQNNNKKQEIE